MVCVGQDVGVDRDSMVSAFGEVFDQALLFHGYTEHMRDYELFIYATADPATGIEPDHLRYRFTCCVEANVRTTVADRVWQKSLDDRLIDHATATADQLDGYVWGVDWQVLYPGLELVARSTLAEQWSRRLGFEMHEATIEGNAHRVQLVFKDLEVTNAAPGDTPFRVSDRRGPDGKWPLSG